MYRNCRNCMPMDPNRDADDDHGLVGYDESGSAADGVYLQRQSGCSEAYQERRSHPPEPNMDVHHHRSIL